MLAVLLGPAGVGLAGIYLSITTGVGILTECGMFSSGVRQIAKANKDGDWTRVAKIAIVISRVVFITNLFGGVIICLFSRLISQTTFGNKERASGVAVMSLFLFFTGIADGKKVILEGLQRIKDIVTCQVLGAILGAFVSVTIVYFFRERGVAWFLVATPALSIATIWWFAWQVKLPSVRVSLAATVKETKNLFKLGIGMMANGVLTSTVAYITSIIIIRKLGLKATGQYQAGYTLSSYYIGFILNAMRTSFYPKLSGVSDNNEEANRLLNEQIEVGLLLAIPGIAATLALAPWVLSLLYTREFDLGAGIVQWSVIAVFFRMISWPLWHLQVAKGLGRLLVITESLFATLQILLNWFCIGKWGLEGAGIAYMLSFMAHAAAMYVLCRRLSGFRWSRGAFVVSISGFLLLVFSFAGVKLLPLYWGAGLGLGWCLVACVGSLTTLQKVLNVNIKMVVLRRFAANTP